jgi:hypothetical protein
MLLNSTLFQDVLKIMYLDSFMIFHMLRSGIPRVVTGE